MTSKLLKFIRKKNLKHHKNPENNKEKQYKQIYITNIRGKLIWS